MDLVHAGETGVGGEAGVGVLRAAQEDPEELV